MNPVFSKKVNYYDYELRPGDIIVDDDNNLFTVSNEGKLICNKDGEEVEDVDFSILWSKRIWAK